ncbi:hypothetical protein BST61_g2954 [Cercospora zeina]
MPQAQPELKKYLDKRVEVQLNGSRKVMGTLRGYDVFLNIVLDEATESKANGDKSGYEAAAPRTLAMKMGSSRHKSAFRKATAWRIWEWSGKGVMAPDRTIECQECAPPPRLPGFHIISSWSILLFRPCKQELGQTTRAAGAGGRHVIARQSRQTTDAKWANNYHKRRLHMFNPTAAAPSS